MSLINLTPAQLRHAAALKEKIESLQHELSRLHDSGRDGQAETSAGRPRKKISAAGIARIRAAQKKRWAKFRGGADRAGKRGPRKMSAAARAKIAAAARARWARVRAEKAGK